MVRILQKNRINALGAVFFLSLLQLSACSSGGEKTSWNPFSKKEDSSGLGTRRSPKENTYYAGVPVRQGASLTGVQAAAIPQPMPYKQESVGNTMPYGAAPYANSPVASSVPYGNAVAPMPPVYNPAYPAPQVPVGRPVTLSMPNGAMPEASKTTPYAAYNGNAARAGMKEVPAEETPSYFQRIKNVFHKDESTSVSRGAPVMPITNTAVASSPKKSWEAAALPPSLPSKGEIKTLPAPVAMKKAVEPVVAPAKPPVVTVAVKPVVKPDTKQVKHVAEVKHVKKTTVTKEVQQQKKTVVSSSEKKKPAHDTTIVKKQKVAAKAPVTVATLPSRKEFPSLSTVPSKPARLNKPDELKTEQDELLQMQKKMKEERKKEENSGATPAAVPVMPAPTSDKLVVPPMLQVPLVAAAPTKMPQQAKPAEASNSMPLPTPSPVVAPKMVIPPVLPAVDEPVLAPVQTPPALPSPVRAVPSQPFPPSSAVDRPRKAAVVTSAVPSSDDDVREYR